MRRLRCNHTAVNIPKVNVITALADHSLPRAHPYRSRAHVAGRPRARRRHRMAQEMLEIHLDLGPIVPGGAKIDVLALRLGWIPRCPRYPRRELLDLQDVVVRLPDPGEHGGQVEPLPRRPLEGTVVRIEAVYIDEGTHDRPLKKQGPPKRPRALRSKPQGVLRTM